MSCLLCAGLLSGRHRSECGRCGPSAKDEQMSRPGPARWAVAGCPRLGYGASRISPDPTTNPSIHHHQQDEAAPMSDEDDNLDYRFQNLHEFVKVARQNLNRNNWDYLIGASESETT